MALLKQGERAEEKQELSHSVSFKMRKQMQHLRRQY